MGLKSDTFEYTCRNKIESQIGIVKQECVFVVELIMNWNHCAADELYRHNENTRCKILGGPGKNRLIGNHTNCE